MVLDRVAVQKMLNFTERWQGGSSASVGAFHGRNGRCELAASGTVPPHRHGKAIRSVEGIASACGIDGINRKRA